MSTAFLHCRPECEARGGCRYATPAPGAAPKPRMYNDMRVPVRLLTNRSGTGQPRLLQNSRSERPRPAQIPTFGSGFPLFLSNCTERKAPKRHSLPVFLLHPP
jgi:hypothetical protein